MRERVLELLKEKSYRLGNYTLSSGKETEHYVNCKTVTLNGEGLYLISNMMLDRIDKDCHAVAGLTLGADPLVSGVAVCSALDGRLVNGLIVRKEPKGHGTKAWIEGPEFKEGTKVTVLEDVVTSGGSAIKAAEKLRDAGYIVDRVVTIVDRQEGGEDAMKAAKLELKSLFLLEDIVNHKLTL